MTDDLRRLLVRELEAFAREVELFPDDASLWKTLPGVTNSAGNLALHVCGNLKHYLGGVLGGSGYVRNRDLEFASRAGSRDDVARQLRETAGIVRQTLARLSAEGLAAPYPEPIANMQLPCGRWLMHLAVHLGFHLGQAGYLRRVVTGDGRSSGALPLAALADR